MTLAASIPPFTDTERRLHKAVARGWRQDLKTTVEQTSDARVDYRITVRSSGAASICQRASMKDHRQGE